MLKCYRGPVIETQASAVSGVSNRYCDAGFKPSKNFIIWSIVSLPKVISKRCEMVKLRHINRTCPVFDSVYTVHEGSGNGDAVTHILRCRTCDPVALIPGYY